MPVRQRVSAARQLTARVRRSTPTRSDTGSWRPHPALVAVVYLVAWTALDLAAERFQAASGVSVWYPPTALDVVMLLLFGLRYSPLLLLSTVLHTAVLIPVGLSWVQIVVFAAGTTAGYAAVAAVLLRGVRLDPRLVTQRDTGWFVAIACVAGPLLVVAAQVGLLVAAGAVPRREAAVSVAGLWAGTATGVGMLAPVLLVAARRWRSRWAGSPPPPPDHPGLPVSRGEQLGQLLALAATTYVAYGLPGGQSLNYTYLVYVPLIWIAVRGGFTPTVIAVLVANVVAAVSNGGRVPGQGGIALQFGLVTLTLVALLLGALVTQRRVDAERHRHAALHDPLTGLANRALFTDRLAQALHRTARQPDHCFAVLFLDLDRFKAINDSLGHAAGDAVLVEVGHRLQAATRPGDSVARLGGDEFAVLAEPLHSTEELSQLADRVLHTLSVPHQLGGQRVTATGSVGSVLCPSQPSPGTEPAQLLRDADVALHRAKRAGRAQHVVFDAPMHSQALERLQIEEALRRTVDSDDPTGELTVVFQPVFALPDGGVVAAEALARWQPAGGSAVPPDLFVPLAEDTGLIHQLGRLVLQQACATAVSSALPGAAPLRVAVNVSPLELRRPDYPRAVRDVLAATGLPPDRLELEITEGQWLQGDETAQRTLAELVELGVRLVIDDFGSGYASFAYLERIPLTGLKIDQSFIAGLPHRFPAAIVSGVLALAAELGLPITAEGIKTSEQLDFLVEHGCTQAQGFLLARPGPFPAPPGGSRTGAGTRALRALPSS